MHTDDVTKQVRDRIEIPRRMYEVHGLRGLKQLSDTDITLLMSSKRDDACDLSTKIDGGNGTEADLLRKQKLQIELEDIGGEVRERLRGMER